MSEQNDIAAPSAEYAAEQAARSGQVPDKFKNEDGSVNVDLLAQSYRELETRFHKKEQPVAESNDQSVQAGSPVSDRPIEGDLGAMLDGPKRTVWDRVADESKSGSISEDTLEALKAEGVPDEIVASYVDGIKARSEARTRAAADVVGGAKNLNAVMTYARDNFTPAQLEAFKSQLNGPTWDIALKGLAATAGVSINPIKEPKSFSTGGPAATPESDDPRPFETQREMTAAIADRRYQVDAAYRELVQARIRASV